jgi:hypothetical protein
LITLIVMQDRNSLFRVMLITEWSVVYPYRGHRGATRIHIWPLPEIRYFEIMKLCL